MVGDSLTDTPLPMAGFQDGRLYGSDGVTPYGYKSSDGRTFYWYNTARAETQCNDKNSIYYYVAIR